ncbi:MAG: hypothetical protein AAF236_14480 [Verrucomicrobiota bacterium]
MPKVASRNGATVAAAAKPNNPHHHSFLDPDQISDHTKSSIRYNSFWFCQAGSCALVMKTLQAFCSIAVFHHQAIIEVDIFYGSPLRSKIVRGTE